MKKYKLIAISMDGRSEVEAYEKITKECESLEVAENYLREISNFAKTNGIDMVYGVYQGINPNMLLRGFINRNGVIETE